MNRHVRWIVVSVCTLAWTSSPTATKGQGPSGGAQRGNQRSGGSSFGIQVGPGGVQFGAGSGPSGPNTRQPSPPGTGFNNPGSSSNNSNNNWNRPGWNNNNWNNWNRTSRPPVVVQTPTVLNVPVTPAPPSPPAEPILLVNPAGNPAAVSYRVNQYSYVLPPGGTQQLDGYRTWTIDYDRGSNYGRQAYGLVPGKTYRFAPGPRGWELYVVQPEASLPSPPAE